MTRHIEAAKTSMRDVVSTVTRTNPHLKMRVAVVAYRDICDVNRFEELNFTDSVAQFEGFVSKLQATGGGDAPEDLAGAIQKANQLSWQQVSRVTFVISDCPCHGREFHTLEDSYPQGTPGICIKIELHALMKKGGDGGMRLVFGRITKWCDDMIQVFASNGIKFDVYDIKDPSKLSAAVSSSVSESISKSSESISTSFAVTHSKAMLEE